MDKIDTGIQTAVNALGSTQAHGNSMARAIMTTDTRQKAIAVRLKINNKDVTIGGIAKGAGMIAPNLATMLCFLTTDGSMPAMLLNECLKNSAESSFNRITIDGHMSTNDTIAIIANGASGITIPVKNNELQIFQQGFDYETSYLAKAIVMDGEGATKFVQIDVIGAKSKGEATRIARSIADSPLVKTALNGEDPKAFELGEAAYPPLVPSASLLAGMPPAPPAGSRGKANLILPAKFDLLATQSPVKDQGQRGTCSYFSTVALVEHLYRAATPSESPVLSEQYAIWLVASKGKVTDSIFTDLEVYSEHGGLIEASVWPYGTKPWTAPAHPECGHLPLRSLSRIAQKVRLSTRLPVEVF